MRRVPDLRIQVAPLIVSPILSRSKISRRGLARALLPSIVPELPIRSRIFAPEGCLSQVAGAVTGSSDNTNILLAVTSSNFINVDLKIRKIIVYRNPNPFNIDAEIMMNEKVSHSRHLLPGDSCCL